MLEHTPTPTEFLDRVVRLARPGGVVVLSTQNVASLVARAFRMRWSLVIEDHFTYSSRASLEPFARRAGLEVRHVGSAGIGHDFFRWVDRLQRLRRRPAPAGPAAGTSSSIDRERAWTRRPRSSASRKPSTRRSTGPGRVSTSSSW